MIGESVVVWGHDDDDDDDDDDYVVGVGVLEDLQRVVIGVDDDRDEYLMNESGEWISDEQTYKMTKPKTMDHLLTGDDQLGGATLTKANLGGATLTKANLRSSNPDRGKP